jgi:hypothetical protein
MPRTTATSLHTRLGAASKFDWVLWATVGLMGIGCLDVGAGEANPERSTDGADDDTEIPDSTDTGDGSSGNEPTEGSANDSWTPNDQPVCVDFGEPCSACELDACPDLFCNCYDNPECGLLGWCMLGCEPGDAVCVSDCTAQHPAGTSDAVLLSDCAITECTAACTHLNLPPALDDCTRCTYRSCGAQMDACFAIAACPPLLACYVECAGDPTCQGVCALAYPAGVQAAQVAGTCSLTHCSSACS